MNRRWAVAMLAVSWAAETGRAQQQLPPMQFGTIQGRVMLAGGSQQPLAGAAVTAYYIDPALPEWGPRAVARAIADDQGAYMLDRLRPGEYVLCTVMIGSDLVNGCEWEMPKTRVTVRAGQATTGVDRTVARGRAVVVDVDDPAEHLDKNLKKGGGGVDLLVGVWGADQRFRVARVVEKGKKKRTYAIVVPFDTPVGLVVRGRKLDLDDDKGNAKKETDPPVAINEKADNSGQAKKFLVRVKGVRL